MTRISKTQLSFLKQLSLNNNREWFALHKTAFKTHEAEVKLFFKAIENDLKITDDIDYHKVLRIYRDVRFSKDKTPYKPRFAGSFKRASAKLRGGYWLQIEPGNTQVGGGFFNPNPQDLLRIRKEIECDDTTISAILKDEQFQQTFGGLQGDEVKTAPRGFDKKHPAIHMIKKKQFYAMRSFSDAEVVASDFKEKIIETYTALRPFFDFMSEVLTTDLNGVSIVDA
jgi:uncharacterized protein (TIGR02453 family)